MSETSPRLSFREKSGYAFGDAAANLAFQTMLYYQLTFYTDALGIAAGAAGTLLFAARFFDAVFDPVIGVLADRTQTRWGKFRPWVLGTAIPFGLMFWLAFRSPHFGASGKLVYAYVTYIGLMMLYSASNTPYSALNAVMTGDNEDRTSLSSFRFVAAMTASLVVQSFTLPMVTKFGHGDKAAGWSIVVGAYAVIAAVFLVITFLSARERIKPAQVSKFSEDVKDLIRNGPWLAIFGVTLFMFTMLALRGGSLYYYFTYFADRGSEFDYLRSWGFALKTDPLRGIGSHLMEFIGLRLAPDHGNASDVIQWLFNLTGSLVTLLGVFASRPLASRFGRKAVFLAGMVATTAVTALFVLVGPKSVGTMFLFTILWPACYGPTVPLLWVMIADVVDFSEWKTGRRATGFAYAGIVFALKAALGLGGWIQGKVLDFYHYVPNAVQESHALEGIRLSATVYPAVPFALAALCAAIYPLSKARTLQISNDLEARRRQGGAAAATTAG
ncbi:MAG TPA: MFS transporter [Opitutaceae bacterium]|jgi:Na+/melibiose symporter-like transporter